jgi:hypothetical protein
MTHNPFRKIKVYNSLSIYSNRYMNSKVGVFKQMNSNHWKQKKR